jgi:hypothetical protein
MNTEIWKDVRGYEGLYSVSNYGNVRSEEREVWNGLGYRLVKQRILKPVFDSKRLYLYVILSNEGSNARPSIHRLVAEAFIPNLDSKPEVNHIDGITFNNRLDNLEWMTRSENKQHRHKLNPPLPVKLLPEILRLRSLGCSQQSIGDTLGIHQTKISTALRKASTEYAELPPYTFHLGA